MEFTAIVGEFVLGVVTGLLGLLAYTLVDRYFSEYRSVWIALGMVIFIGVMNMLGVSLENAPNIFRDLHIGPRIAGFLGSMVFIYAFKRI
ncbi:hypothetical protein ACFL08_05155 [Patescibacteria group bacterium]